MYLYMCHVHMHILYMYVCVYSKAQFFTQQIRLDKAEYLAWEKFGWHEIKLQLLQWFCIYAMLSYYLLYCFILCIIWSVNAKLIKLYVHKSFHIQFFTHTYTCVEIQGDYRVFGMCHDNAFICCIQLWFSA